jgi:hypothetical protein
MNSRRCIDGAPRLHVPRSCTAVFKRRPGQLNVTAFCGAEAGVSFIGPRLPSWSTRWVVSNLGYTGAADGAATAALDPSKKSFCPRA